LLGIAGWSVVVYVTLLAGLRLGGRREVGQLTRFDLVLVLLVANAVQNAMVGPDTSLAGGLVAAGALFAINAGVARLRLRSTRFRHLVDGVPTVLVQHGDWVRQNLDREGLTDEEVLAALREHGEVADVSRWSSRSSRLTVRSASSPPPLPCIAAVGDCGNVGGLERR